MLQEEKGNERASVAALDTWWNDLALDELPSCLAYLLLECCAVTDYRIAFGWFDSSARDCGAGSAGMVYLGVSPEQALRIALSVLAFRRRRERSLPEWRARYQQLTNRTNRVQNRVLHLVREQVRDECREARV